MNKEGPAVYIAILLIGVAFLSSIDAMKYYSDIDIEDKIYDIRDSYISEIRLDVIDTSTIFDIDEYPDNNYP